MAENRDDTLLLSALNSFVTDMLGWLGDYPDDQVSPAALAAMRDSVAGVVQRLPVEQRRRLEELAAADARQATIPPDHIDSALLKVVVGLFIDLVWWLDTCPDHDVDPDTAVKLLESAGAAVPDDLRGRLLDVIRELAATEQDPARRRQFAVFPFATGLVDEEPDDPPAPTI